MSPPEGNRTASGPKALPSVDRVLRMPGVDTLIAQHGHSFVAAETKRLLADWRRALADASPAPSLDLHEKTVVSRLTAAIEARIAPPLRPVFNLTGTVLHTNLGRAVLPEAAVDALMVAARAPIALEFDLASGRRGDRDTAVEGLLCELTGAEAATVVNNNAAAVLLTIAALAARREVVISRGELIEIGGAFRMPDVMRCAGARMVEVGTTNRTHGNDYARALNERTGLVLKAHTSNYVVTGFMAAVPEDELAAIAHAAGVPLAVDLGSGSLVDLAQYGLPREPRPQDSLARGADIVTFSGDKLLGGPQAGLIVGKADLIGRLRRHPLKRALRVSKTTLAALAATLALYRHPEHLLAALPTLRLLTRSQGEIVKLTRRVAPALAHALGADFSVTDAPMQSQIGSGSLPVDMLPSAGLVVRCNDTGKRTGRRLAALAAALRALPTPVLGRVADDALVLDFRTLTDEAAFVAQLGRLDLRGSAP